MNKFILTFLILLVFVNGFAFEKVGTTSFQFLKVSMDARSTGMAEAHSAAVYSTDAVFWNPAALTQIKNLDVSVYYLDWLLDTYHSSFAVAYNLGNFGTIGFHAMVTNIGDIEVTTVDALGFIGGVYNPGLTGDVISPASMSIGLSYGRRLTDKLSFGLTTKYVEEDFVVDKASTIVFDGGLTYDTGFKTLRIAAVIRHFGPEIKYIDQSYPLPQTFTIGIAGYVFGAEGAVLGNSNDHRLLIAYDMSQPRDFTQQHHVGMEYSIKDMLFLRGGYKFNFGEEGPAFGFGFKVINMKIDYSYSDFGSYLDSVHRFSLGYSIK